MEETTTAKVFAMLLEASLTRSEIARSEAIDAQRDVAVLRRTVDDLGSAAVAAVTELRDEMRETFKAHDMAIVYLSLGVMVLGAGAIVAARRIDRMEAAMWDLQDKVQKLRRAATSGLAS